ncbi:hypothetical protein J914_3172 [Acinetobacter baumannii 25493_1]|nr:hypothetical protein J489_3775 [Acinetobacter baumannii 1040094]EXD93162.1 hypothetical protein J490_3774 [Acinetobacter baumannii 942194]EYD43906.1 hypothetical protein J918_2785 [Acinetobacter baumannii 25493_5]EYD55064.1 hypothetical protein J915_3225 [Acinetobacter baumannii 25493_2]EYD61597.1 hypothetical protein J914_3172 [Acinetobacter baumannii 25493_1]EYS11398.1 hypothetical protein K013_3300 [Acinetobacter baumannii 25569_7]EYS48159.1 hypothetical protein K007_3879 [Acinetobacter
MILKTVYIDQLPGNQLGRHQNHYLSSSLLKSCVIGPLKT